MWRTHKAYKLSLEKQTDENIMRSKEHATKLQEPTISFLQVMSINSILDYSDS